MSRPSTGAVVLGIAAAVGAVAEAVAAAFRWVTSRRAPAKAPPAEPSPAREPPPDPPPPAGEEILAEGLEEARRGGP